MSVLSSDTNPVGRCTTLGRKRAMQTDKRLSSIVSLLLLGMLSLSGSSTGSAQQTEATATTTSVYIQAWGQAMIGECPPTGGIYWRGVLEYKAVVPGTRFRLTNKTPEVAKIAPEGGIPENEAVSVVKVSASDGDISLNMQCLSPG